jgi:hypothetical protein
MTLATVNIYRQFSLSVHFAQIFVEPLLKLIMFRETCIENCTLPIFLAKADSAHERRFDLLIGQAFLQTIKKEWPCGAFR